MSTIFSKASALTLAALLSVMTISGCARSDTSTEERSAQPTQEATQPTASQEASQTSTDSKAAGTKIQGKGYTFVIPDGFESGKSIPPADSLIQLQGGDKTINANVVLTPVGENMTIDKALPIMESTLKPLIPDLKIEKFSLNGNDAIRMSGFQAKIDHYTDQTAIHHGEYIYIVTWTTTAERFKEIEAPRDAMLNSMSFD